MSEMEGFVPFGQPIFQAATAPLTARGESYAPEGLRVFPTGAVRDGRRGKGRFDLLLLGFARAMRRVAFHCEEGAIKYCDRNWERGQPLSAYLDSAARHMTMWSQGEVDEDHLVALAWNALAALETRERIDAGLLPPELDDLKLSEASGISSISTD